MVRGMGSVMNVKIELPQHYIETEGSLVQRSLRSLKDGDAFAVFDEYGDIGVIGTGPWGDSSRRTVFDRRRQYLSKPIMNRGGRDDLNFPARYIIT